MADSFMERLMECDHSLLIEEMTNVADGDLQKMECDQCQLESEIERMMFVALLSTSKALSDWVFMPACNVVFSCAKEAMDDLKQKSPRHEIFVCPQMKVEAFRVDFGILFSNANGRMSGYALECDGHNFHEKTKSQAARDKARDRDIVRAGLKVLRYTGSEIWRDPFRCAVEILQDAESDFIDVMYEQSQRDAA